MIIRSWIWMMGLAWKVMSEEGQNDKQSEQKAHDADVKRRELFLLRGWL